MAAMSATAPPDWFRRALAAPFEERWATIGGVPIHYADWGNRGAPGLVLIHGGAAHLHWWTFLAPMFASDWHVVALDLSGHGDSGRRDDYSHEAWACEVLGVAHHAGFPGPPVLVGHSLGGMVVIQAASQHGPLLAGAVVVDSPVRRPDPESEEATRGRAFRSPGVYPDLESALQHFHLIPAQPCENDFLLDHVARHSLHETPAGWTWKFDPHLFTHTLIPLRDQLASVRCRIALLRGEYSVVVPPDTAEYMYDLLGRNAPLVSIPEAHHHLILDQPLAFVSALRTLLADWDHSIPRSGAGGETTTMPSGPPCPPPIPGESPPER
jgi:pimeloyl-ACP methyl ester carboxylesterase